MNKAPEQFPSRFTYIAAFVAYVIHGYAGY